MLLRHASDPMGQPGFRVRIIHAENDDIVVPVKQWAGGDDEIPLGQPIDALPMVLDGRQADVVRGVWLGSTLPITCKARQSQYHENNEMYFPHIWIYYPHLEKVT